MNQAEYFDNLAATWDTEERPDITARVARVVAAGRLAPGLTVLDVGTGTGILLPLLAEEVGEAGRIVALDISAGMLTEARKKAPPGPISYLQADIEASGLPNASFDRIFCNAVYPHFTDSAHALREIHRLLHPSGMLVISHPIGRDAVNAIHSGASDVVTGDRVPLPDVLRSLMEQSGFRDVSIVDEPDFYLATGSV